MNNFKQLPILVTGGCGMVGSHIVDYYYDRGFKIYATYFTRPTISDLETMKNKADYRPLDIREKSAVFSLIEEIRPEVIYHLAAQSFPTVSWEKPDETLDININGTVHVMEGIKAVKKQYPDYDPMVVIACSSAEYGAALTPENTPITETAALLPLHPYGVSKVGQDLLGFQYYQNDNIRNIRARIFNTTGPRKINDVASDFTKRACLWEQGKENSIRVGNISTQRAITDVRDLVNALILLSEKGKAGEAYNISGQKAYPIRDIITIIEDKLKKTLPVETDLSLMRPSDEAIIFGNSSKLIQDTGWSQSFTLEQTISDMIDYWRESLD